MFTATEQSLLLETYEEVKQAILQLITLYIHTYTPPAHFTPAEELELNKRRFVIEGIEGGTSSEFMSPN